MGAPLGRNHLWGRSVGGPTIGCQKLVWYKLRQYPNGRRKLVQNELRQCPQLGEAQGPPRPPRPKLGVKEGGSTYLAVSPVSLPTCESNFAPSYLFLSASIASKMGTNLFITLPVVGHSTGASQSSRGLKNSSPEVSHPPSG